MTTWILSPNVHNDATENAWKNTINQTNRAFIGYNTNHRFGVIFNEQIQIGDIILIAQGMNSNKRLFLCGEVASDSQWEHLENTPGFAQNRKLVNVLNQAELLELNLDFNGSKWGDSKQPATLYDLEPDHTEQDRIIQQLLWNRILRKRGEIKAQPIIDLLKYKKQIILQGPPGTGKTKLAEEIAEQLLTKQLPSSQYDVLKDFIKNFQVSDEVQRWRDLRKERRETFLQKFPKEKLANLTFEEYCIGQEIKDNFCWWIERGLQSYGRYTPGTSLNYYVYFNKDEQSYKTLKRFNSQDDALNDVTKFISYVANEQMDEEGFHKIGTGYILRILAIYHPDKYVHLFKQENQIKIAKILRIYEQQTFIELNRAIKLELDKLIKETRSFIEIEEIIHFLFQTLLVGQETEIKENHNQTVIKSKPTIIQFHPSFSYEDFVRGISTEDNGNSGISYKTQNKVLARIAKEALENDTNDFVLIIDEINRANLSAVLGELIYALENRGKPVNSMYAIDGDDELIIPPNLYIIGTMNTADRSVGTIDYAIRRRFAFVNIPARDLREDGEENFDSELFQRVSTLFKNNLSSEFNLEDVLLGHSYFIDKSKEKDGVDMSIRWKYEIQPILLEYVKDGILIGDVNSISIKEHIEKWEA